jgi:hypothetical protein
MPKTHIPSRKTCRKKPATDIIGRIATDPCLFLVEAGSSAPGAATFCFSIYASKEADRAIGMSRLAHQSGFNSLGLAVKALLKKLEAATSQSDTKFTTAHLNALERRMSVKSQSFSVSLREILQKVK